MTLSQSEKQRIVLNSLLKLYPSSEHRISPNEFAEQLDRRLGNGTFDRDLLGQLIEQLEIEGKPLTPENFAHVWAEADERLAAQRMGFQEESQRAEAAVDQFRRKQREHAGQETVNEFGLGSSAYINVFVRSVEQMRVHGSPQNMGFELELEGTRERFGPSDNPNLFLVDQNLTFPVRNPSSQLKITAMDMTGNRVAEQFIQLGEFIDQKQHQKTFRILGPDNQISAVLNCDVQFVHSLGKLYDALIPENEMAFQQARARLSEADGYIGSLHAPFPELYAKPITMAPLEMASSAVHPSSIAPVVAGGALGAGIASALGAIGSSAMNNMGMNNMGMNNIAGSPFYSGMGGVTNLNSVKLPPKFGTYLGPQGYFTSLDEASGIIYLIISLIGGMLRSTLLDSFLAMIIIGISRLGVPLMGKFSSFALLGFSVLAIILGFAWLSVYAKNFWSTGYIDNFLNLGTRKIAVLAEFLLLACRAYSAYFFFTLSKKIPQSLPFFAMPQMPLGGQGVGVGVHPTAPLLGAPAGGMGGFAPGIGQPIGSSFTPPGQFMPGGNIL